jgi:hypothetical protein
MKKNNESEPVEVFTGTIQEAELVKTLLENAEIEVYLKDEIMGTMFPWLAAPGGAGSVKVIVAGENYEKSMSIVEEYIKNIKHNA